jgi:hypothetical protein
LTGILEEKVGVKSGAQKLKGFQVIFLGAPIPIFHIPMDYDYCRSNTSGLCAKM